MVAAVTLHAEILQHSLGQSRNVGSNDPMASSGRDEAEVRKSDPGLILPK